MEVRHHAKDYQDRFSGSAAVALNSLSPAGERYCRSGERHLGRGPSGVTVEAASPVLIEKTRAVVTDGEGRYNIVDLRPGTYVVTFSLAGFSTVKREGIVLTGGFTAAVNADLQVGAVEETITVTAASPVVDTQNVRQQSVLSADVLSALPTGNKTMA